MRAWTSSSRQGARADLATSISTACFSRAFPFKQPTSISPKALCRWRAESGGS